MSFEDHEYSAPQFQFSNYVKCLNLLDRERYVAKLQIKNSNGSVCTLEDPYLLKNWSEDLTLWPNLEYPDVFHFLTETPGDFTAECLKNYKSLSAYDYVLSGKVQKVLVHKPTTVEWIRCLITEVQPSQRLNMENYKPWILIKTDGQVLTAHCTCIAGLGETCSHVAALLFKIENAVRLGYTKKAPTEEICRWNKSFTKKIELVPIVQLNFSKQKWGKPTSSMPKKRKKTELISDADIATLKSIQPNAAFFSLIAEDSDTDSASEIENSVLPESILKIVKKIPPNHDSLAFISSYFTEDSCKEIEAATRGQSNNENWCEQRRGRITSSHFGDLVKMKSWTKAFVQKIITPSYNLNVEAVKWGRQKEKIALNMYMARSKIIHSNFTIKDCGLFVPIDMPYIGASPDAVVSCSCCGMGLVEIKCPFKYRSISPKAAASLDNKFCLNADLTLKENHPYFFQIQGQLMITNKEYCDFVVWSPVDIVIVRIRPEPETHKNIRIKAQDLFCTALFPAVKTL